MLQVLVTGATGFLGRRIVPDLLARRHQVRCLIRTPGTERIFDSRSVDVHYGSVQDADSVSQAMYDVQSVVHLVGIIRERRGQSFDSVHRQGTSNVVEAAKAAGVREIVYVSALGATANPQFPYLESKWRAEQCILASGLGYTILRPSVIFGPGDEFLTALAGLVRLGPVVPVIGAGKNRMQPVSAADVGRCVVESVGNPLVKGRALNLGGSQRLNYVELLHEVARAMDKRVRTLHIPVPLALPGVLAMQALTPRPPITTGQLKMLSIRNVADGRDIDDAFGFTPEPLRGNIDYVNQVSFGDALRMTLGLSRRRTR